jgi:hypothetical protein
MEAIGNVIKNCVGKSERKITVRRLRDRWDVDIKMDLRKIGSYVED